MKITLHYNRRLSCLVRCYELIRKLAKDGNYKMSILIALGCFTGLRISDILALTWEQILSTEEFTIMEKKTGKRRALRLNTQLQQHIQECYEHIQPLKVQSYILVSQKGTVFTILRINVILKEIKKLRLFLYICLDYELFIAFGTP